MRSVFPVLWVTCLLAGCGPQDLNKDGIADGVKEPNSVSLVAPSTPIGTLSGQVLTTRLTPLEGAKVSLAVGSRAGEVAVAPTSSDASGNFTFTGLPAGAQVMATISKDGYATMRATAIIPSAAGNFPINDGNSVIGPFTLTQLNGTAKFMVITKQGRMAKGAKATLEASPAGTVVNNTGGTYGGLVGIVVADGVVDDQGLLTFTGIPAPDELTRLGGNYDVTIQGFDENGDGTIDYLGMFQRFSAQSLVINPSPRVLTLASARAPSTLALDIAASNVDSIITPGSPPAKNMVRAAESLYFVFNQPVLDASLTVRLTDEFGVQSIVISKSLKVGTALTVSSTTPLEVGKEYNISVRATSADNGTFFARAAYFFVADPATPKPFSVATIQFRDTSIPPNGTLNVGETVVLTFNQPLSQIGPTPAEAFIDFDFDADTKMVTPGEKGAATGFALVASEPVAEKDTLFALQPSSYTTRFTFVLAGATVGVPNLTPISVPFGKLLTATGGYQTIWGTPIASEESSNVSIAPP